MLLVILADNKTLELNNDIHSFALTEAFQEALGCEWFCFLFLFDTEKASQHRFLTSQQPEEKRCDSHVGC